MSSRIWLEPAAGRAHPATRRWPGSTTTFPPHNPTRWSPFGAAAHRHGRPRRQARLQGHAQGRRPECRDRRVQARPEARQEKRQDRGAPRARLREVTHLDRRGPQAVPARSMMSGETSGAAVLPSPPAGPGATTGAGSGAVPGLRPRARPGLQLPASVRDGGPISSIRRRKNAKGEGRPYRKKAASMSAGRSARGTAQ